MGRTKSAGWLSVEPSEGSGQGRLTYSAVESNNGRNTRTKQSHVTGESGDECTVTVNQLGRGLYVKFNPTSYEVSNAGGPVTVYGLTNAKMLTFSVSSDTDNIITIDSNGYKASVDGGNTYGGYITNGSGPVSDPGTVQEWEFAIVVTVASTSGTSDSVARLRVTASDGIGTQATSLSGNNPDASITRSGSDGYTQVGEKPNGPWDDEIEINIEWSRGSYTDAYVDSNERWEVTIDSNTQAISGDQ